MFFINRNIKYILNNSNDAFEPLEIKLENMNLQTIVDQYEKGLDNQNIQ